MPPGYAIANSPGAPLCEVELGALRSPLAASAFWPVAEVQEATGLSLRLQAIVRRRVVTFSVSRALLADGRKLFAELALHRVNLAPQEPGNLQEYLHAFLATNDMALPLIAGQSSMGWDTDKRAFLYGT